MSSRSFLYDLLADITERGRRMIGVVAEPASAQELIALADSLLSGRGEASGVAIARQILDGYAGLDEESRLEFFSNLASRYDTDRDRLTRAARAFLEAGTDEDIAALKAAAEGKRQELIRRLNLAPGGTAALVAMRADLLALLDDNPGLRGLDADFEQMFAAWFNRGFLVLRHIDWDTPASILERIIRYEAVHAIHDWEDLRNRIDRPDRRLYAFFHPALVDEPLIFVEVALDREMPAAIAPILDKRRDGFVNPAEATVAAFYSISNCQEGLRGISFGNFLIKQVVDDLRSELPELRTFVTLSPVPAFRAWLERQREGAGDVVLTAEQETAIDRFADGGWTLDPEGEEAARRALMPLAAAYFLDARDRRGRPVDPVARFHLQNGARLERLNWMGDNSPKGMNQGAGLMVNYLYDLKDIEKNHEAFANEGIVAAAPAVRKLVKAQAPRPARTTAAE